MRFPKIPWQQRLFDLFSMLKLEQDGLVAGYVLSLPQNLNLFNGVKLTNEQVARPLPDEPSPHDPQSRAAHPGAVDSGARGTTTDSYAGSSTAAPPAWTAIRHGDGPNTPPNTTPTQPHPSSPR